MNNYKDLVSKLDLRAIIAPGKRITGDKPVLLNCFWHDDRHESLAVYPDHLYCYGCQKHLTALEWIADQERLDIRQDFGKVVEVLANKYVSHKVSIKEKKRWVASGDISFMKSDIVQKYHSNLGRKRQWYHDRGLTDEIIDSQLLGYDGRAFTIPVWHPCGQLLTIRFRRDDLLSINGPKYWGIEGHNKTLLYNEIAMSGASSVVICEGELDCLRLWQEGVPAISSTNGVHGMLRIWREVKCACKFFIIAFDQDDMGREAAKKLRRMINGTCKHSPPRSTILKWNIKLGKDVTELAQNKGVSFVKEKISEAVEGLESTTDS